MGNGSSSSRSAREAAPAAPVRAEHGVQHEQRQQQPSSTKTVVLKVNFHCRRCPDKVRKILLLVDGVQSVSTDMANNRVTVKGTMDVDAMLLFLRKKIRKHADVQVQVEESNSEGGGGGGDAPAAENPVPGYDYGGGGMYFDGPTPQGMYSNGWREGWRGRYAPPHYYDAAGNSDNNHNYHDPPGIDGLWAMMQDNSKWS